MRSIGISGKDGALLKVAKKYSDGQDIGYVGEVTEVNEQIIYDLLEKDFLPIICPVGMDENYHTYNINAGDAACAIARAVKAEKLAFLTDIEGVYKDPEDPSTLISELCVKEAEKLMTEVISEGECFRNFRTVSMRSKQVFQECIFLTEGFRIVFFLRFSLIKGSEQRF